MKTMNKLFALLLALALAAALPALAQDTAPIEGVLERQDIPFAAEYPENLLIQGESPTTGLKWESVYAPVMMVIDNAEGAHPHWGLKDTDILYQVPNAGKGATKLLALFSDTAPQAAGGSRSARTPFVDVARTWGAAFVYAGYPGEGAGAKASVPSKLREGGMRNRQLSFNLLSNNDFSTRISGYQSPHNLSVDIARVKELALENGAVFTPRPFLFTDEKPQGYAPAGFIDVRHYGEDARAGLGNPASYAAYTYVPELNAYQRENSSGPFVDRDTPGVPIPFANVIVQRVRFSYSNGYIQLNYLTGSGAADIFTGGSYIPGGWSRASLDSRTVFTDDKGFELSLQRGKTFIILTND
ncbi:MAG: DUF3048 domain-containing protein, partial [Eubacteriales bacterium]|nr:DUF3048 domain-containing protein [Eubacteriales bacterium]